MLTPEQTTALKLLLKRYGEAVYDASSMENHMSRANDCLAEEAAAEKEIIDYINSILTSETRLAAATVLDKSFWDA